MKVAPSIILMCLLCFASNNVCSQNKSNFYLDIGYFGRTTFNYYKIPNGQTSGPITNYDAPYSHEKGVNGMGLNVTFGYSIIKEIGVALLASTSLRHDFYKFDSPKNLHTFYFDLGFAVTKSILKKGYIGVGTTTFNINKELHYEVGLEGKILYLEFKSLDIMFGYPVWKLYIEPKLSITSENFPGKIKESANLLTLKIAYRFRF